MISKSGKVAIHQSKIVLWIFNTKEIVRISRNNKDNRNSFREVGAGVERFVECYYYLTYE